MKADTPKDWMPMYWARFLVDTSNMDDAQTGAYALLLGHSWMRGGTVPDDDVQLARLSRSTPARWRTHRVMLAPLFVIEGGTWTQPRLAEVLKEQTEKLQSKIASGRMGGRPAKRNESESKPNGLANVKRIETEVEVEVEQHLKPKPSSRTKPVAAMPLPGWLSPDLWLAFEQHRTACRAKVSEHAKRLLLGTLTELRAQGHDPSAVINQSIERHWKGLFPISGTARDNGRQSVGAAIYAGVRDDGNDRIIDITKDARRVG